MTSVINKRRNLRPITTDSRTIQRVVFYYRVSTDEQAEQRTIDAQREYLHSHYAADFSDSGPTPMRYVGDYTDEGWSGTIPLADRPGGARLLEDAAADKFDVVIVYKVDRLGRSARVLLDAHDELASHGIALTSATEPFDTRPGPMQAIGKFIFQLLGSIAELERSTIQARTMGGKYRVANAGRFVNGQVAFGYTVDDHDALVPNQTIVPELGMSEAQIVVEIFERVVRGQTCYAIADWLTDAGVVSPRRWFNKEHRRLTSANGAIPWSNRRIWETIHNPLYKGVRNLNFDERTLDVQVVPVVDVELWDRANARLPTNNSWSGERDNAYVYLLSRKIRCEAHLSTGEPCGRIYTGGSANGYKYYKCNGNGVQGERQRGERCGALMIRSDRIEQDVWADLVWQVRNPEDALSTAQQTIRDRSERSVEQEARRVELRRRRDELEIARRHLRALGVSGRRPFEEVEEDLAANAKSIAQVDEQLATVEAALEVSQGLEKQFSAAVPLLGQLRAEIDQITAEGDRKTMRALLDDLVSEIRVLDGQTKEPKWEVHWRFRPDATSNVREFTNIQSVVIMGEDPAGHQRRLA